MNLDVLSMMAEVEKKENNISSQNSCVTKARVRIQRRQCICARFSTMCAVSRRSIVNIFGPRTHKLQLHSNSNTYSRTRIHTASPFFTVPFLCSLVLGRESVRRRSAHDARIHSHTQSHSYTRAHDVTFRLFSFISSFCLFLFYLTDL